MAQTNNHLLDGLSRPLRDAILANAQRVQLRANCEVFKSANPNNLVFLNAGAVSITMKMQDGVTPEVGVISREGLLGYQLLLGAESLSSGHLIHGEGSGIVLSRLHLQALFTKNEEFRTRILEFALAQTSASRQLTACSLAHEADQRLARWLLSISHFLGSATVPVTQEVISLMLGVRRTTVSLINTRLERDGVTRTRRGTVTILDRIELTRRSCECFQALVDLQGFRAEDRQSISEYYVPVLSMQSTPTEMQGQR